MLATPPTRGRSRGRSLPLKGGGAIPKSPSPSGEGQGEGEDARICLGIITGAHGVRGRVRIKSFTAEPQAIAGYGALETETGDRRFALEITGEGKGVLIARIDGIDDRDAAERLKGTRLYVRRAALPPPEAEEFYQADLVGLEALRSDGTPMGRVSAVHDFGAGASLEIEDAAGKSLLVPFTRSAVPQIDIAGGRLVIVPPEGLIDAATPAEGAGA